MISNKSLSNKAWKEKKIDDNIIKTLSQKKSISEFFSKLLISRGIDEHNYDNYLNPNILIDFPNPFELKYRLYDLLPTFKIKLYPPYSRSKKE